MACVERPWPTSNRRWDPCGSRAGAGVDKRRGHTCRPCGVPPDNGGTSRSTPDEHDHGSDFYVYECRGATARPFSKPVHTHYERGREAGQ